MKATGVVRRIDDLGRIVIPKEIRRNLRINEGDSIEIFVDTNDVVLKKYSFLDNMVSFSSKLADSFYKIYKKDIIITDKEKVIATSKNLIECLNKDISDSIKNGITNRSNTYTSSNIINGFSSKYYISPLIANSDAIGSIIVLTDDIEEKSVSLLNTILIKELEE